MNPDGIEVIGPLGDRFDEILTPRALELVGLLHNELGTRREDLLAERGKRIQVLADGGTLDFLEETRSVREDDSWRVAVPAPGLVDRRVEITGPTDRKMTINALNSGAKVWLADHEDANTLWNDAFNLAQDFFGAPRLWQLRTSGPDGAAGAHPGMVQACREAFDKVLGDRPNQIDKTLEDVHVTAAELLDVKSTPGEVTEDGLRSNVSVGIQYLESWLRGSGAVGINNLMEDAATAEISRSQVWQWLHNDVELSNGETVTRKLVERLIEEEMAAVQDKVGDDAFANGRWDDARSTFAEMALAEEYVDFLTLPAYERMP